MAESPDRTTPAVTPVAIVFNALPVARASRSTLPALTPDCSAAGPHQLPALDPLQLEKNRTADEHRRLVPGNAVGQGRVLPGHFTAVVSKSQDAVFNRVPVDLVKAGSVGQDRSRARTQRVFGVLPRGRFGEQGSIRWYRNQLVIGLCLVPPECQCGFERQFEHFAAQRCFQHGIFPRLRSQQLLQLGFQFVVVGSLFRSRSLTVSKDSVLERFEVDRTVAVSFDEQSFFAVNLIFHNDKPLCDRVLAVVSRDDQNAIVIVQRIQSVPRRFRAGIEGIVPDAKGVELVLGRAERLLVRRMPRCRRRDLLTGALRHQRRLRLRRYGTRACGPPQIGRA